MSDAIKPAYLIAGSDEAKIAAALARLRARAARETGSAALESFDPPDGNGPPDAEALIAAFPAMSLLGGRRYLVADNVDRWSKKQADAVAERLGDAGPETTVVLRGARPSRRSARQSRRGLRRRGAQLRSSEAARAAQMGGGGGEGAWVRHRPGCRPRPRGANR